MTEPLDLAAAEALWAMTPDEADALVAPDYEYRMYHPLVDAIGAFEKDAKATNRVFTGIDQFDEQMRGVSDGQLLSIQGHSHSGKTLALFHILRKNRKARVCWVVPDEDRPLILAKLASLTTGISARDLEDRVAANDPEAFRILRQVALEEFPNLAVFDRPVDAESFRRAYDECTQAWGEKPNFVVLDFLDQLQGWDAVMPKWDFVKAFGKSHDVPMIVLHQTSRSGGADGQKLTISSGGYGGESHATYIIGVRRKKAALMAELADQQTKFDRTSSEAAQERISILQHDLKVAEYTVTLNLVKNKRPGGSTVDDIDLELEKTTGRLLPLAQGELPRQYRATLPPVRGFATPRGATTTWTQTSIDDDDDYREVTG